MKLVSVGFGNLISAAKIVSIVSPDSAPIKRMIQEVMDSGNVVLSALPPETIAARCEERTEGENDARER